MNLVDAIRQAATQARAPLGPVNAFDIKDPAEQIRVQAEAAVLGTAETGEQAVQFPVSTETTEEGFPHGHGLNLVRMEVFLTPEQMSHMLKAALTSSRSVMTVREAASYLRLPSKEIERLAHDAKLPGFLIEGHWRFLRASIDEWIAHQPTHEEESLENVA